MSPSPSSKTSKENRMGLAGNGSGYNLAFVDLASANMGPKPGLGSQAFKN
jgi:hypothetical protein